MYSNQPTVLPITHPLANPQILMPVQAAQAATHSLKNELIDKFVWKKRLLQQREREGKSENRRNRAGEWMGHWEVIMGEVAGEQPES